MVSQLTPTDRLEPGDLVTVLPRLRRYARVLTGDPRRADDLVAETLARATGEPLGRTYAPSLRTWLFTLMHNLNREQAVPARTPSARMLADTSDDPAHPAEIGTGEVRSGDTATEAMLARILRLPADEREALVLVAVEGLSYVEIATLQRVSIGTVLATLTRAREAMRLMTRLT